MLPAWGKTDKDSGEFHPLAHHSIDVAAVFARMLQLPVIRDRLEAAAGTPLTESTCRRLATLDDLLDAGRARREATAVAVRERTGLSLGDPGYGREFRVEVARKLRETRDAGKVATDFDVLPVPELGRRGVFGDVADPDMAATSLVRQASETFPASWIRRANTVPVRVRFDPEYQAGMYIPTRPDSKTWKVDGSPTLALPPGEAGIQTYLAPGVALHEYVHHLQATVPGLQARWLEYHRCRTTAPDGTREPIKPLTGYTTGWGREDEYRDSYYGREYGPSESDEGLEVMTMAYQDLLGGASCPRARSSWTVQRSY